MHLERFYGSLRVIAQKTLVRCLLIQLATQLLAHLVQHATGSLSAASLNQLLQNLIDGDDQEAHALRCNICRMLPVLAVACMHDLRKTDGLIAIAFD